MPDRELLHIDAPPPKTPVHHPVVDQMVALMRVDPSLSGKELSPMLGLSVSRLARVFKRQVGVSIVEYRNQVRFERFFELLTKSGDRPPTLRLAARMAGFGSYAHFHRLFRERWNRGPRESVRNGISALAAASVPRGTRVHDVVVHGSTEPSLNDAEACVQADGPEAGAAAKRPPSPENT